VRAWRCRRTSRCQSEDLHRGVKAQSSARIHKSLTGPALIKVIHDELVCVR
jgi:hypothetical protein